MATLRFTPEELRQLRTLAAEWGKIVSKRAFGDDGPGLNVDFRTMEQIATAAAQGLTEGTLELLLKQQAGKLPAEQRCPTCGKLCHTEPHTRSLPAQGAEVEQTERVAHCPECRRDFSPLRTALGLDEHGYSSSVIERVVTATARFSSFRDAADAVAMSGIEISESQVRRLAHEVGAELIGERDRKAVEHPPTTPTAEERRDPRRLVAEARSYLGNNRERMDYPRYRREGLPTTSSLVESLVGEFNARVKGKQKHWNRPQGAESILQLRAALLSEDGRLSRYFAERPGNPFRTKRRTNVPANESGVQTTA